jgi:sec-independent protein translocase protein TatA
VSGVGAFVGDLGLPELLVILGIALLIFGPRKIGELGKGLGEGIRGFKSALRGEPDKPVAAASETHSETKPS